LTQRAKSRKKRDSSPNNNEEQNTVGRKKKNYVTTKKKGEGDAIFPDSARSGEKALPYVGTGGSLQLNFIKRERGPDGEGGEKGGGIIPSRWKKSEAMCDGILSLTPKGGTPITRMEERDLYSQRTGKGEEFGPHLRQ